MNLHNDHQKPHLRQPQKLKQETTINPTLLTIEIPKLSEEVAASIQNMLYAMMETFDTQYCHQIERYYRMEGYYRCPPSTTGFSKSNDNNDPF